MWPMGLLLVCLSFLSSFVYCDRARVPRDENEYDLIYASEMAIPKERVKK